MACLAIVCAVLSLQVKVNYDMTRYLPDDSAMKKGMDVMAAEFPSMGADKSIRVMAEGLDPAGEAALLGTAAELLSPSEFDTVTVPVVVTGTLLLFAAA